MKLRHELDGSRGHEAKLHGFNVVTSYVVSTEHARKKSEQAFFNMFSAWYVETGLIGCSSDSRRRTVITNAAQQITTVGGALRDVQSFEGLSSLSVTQRHFEVNGARSEGFWRSELARG